MLTFDKNLFKKLIRKALETGKIGDHEVHSKSDIYTYLAGLFHWSPDTIRKWQNPSSNGPGSFEDIRKLGEIFGVSLFQDTNDVSDDKNIPNLENIKSICISHATIKVYIHPEAPEQE